MADNSQLRNNLIYFAAVYVASLLVYLAVSEALIRLADFELPDATGLAVFFLAAHWAGHQYAIRSGWTWQRADRRALALWYSISALVLSFLVALPFAAFAPELRELPVWAWLAVAVITPLYGWVQYGIARWSFGQIMKRTPQPGVAQ